MTHRDQLNKKVTELFAVSFLGVASLVSLVVLDGHTLSEALGFDLRPWLRLCVFAVVCNVGLRILRGYYCPGCGKSIRFFSKKTPIGFRLSKEREDCQHCGLNLDTAI